MNRRNFSLMQRYVSRWHILNFKGQSFTQIAKEQGVLEEVVISAVERYRMQNGFLSPEEVRKEKEPARFVAKLKKEERLVHAVILNWQAKRLPTKLNAIAQFLKMPKADVRRIFYSLKGKQYIDLKTIKFQNGIFAIPLLELDGKIYTPYELSYAVGKDGIKRFKNPMYCVGYGFEKEKDIGRLQGEQ